jgi:putative ABC transport system permease protein
MFMPWFENVRLAASAIWANRLRSGLTMLGLIIGITAVILVVSLGIGIQKYLKEQFKTWGTNVIQIDEQRAQRDSRPLTLADANALRTQVTTARRVAPVLDGNARIIWKNKDTTGNIQGMTPEMSDMLSIPVVKGRFFTQGEMEKRTRVVVIGNELSQEIFGNEDPVGKTILINVQTQQQTSSDSSAQNSKPSKNEKPKIISISQTLTIIGVTQKGAFEGFITMSRGLMIPLSITQELLIPSNTPFGPRVSRVLLEAKEGESIEQLTFQAVNVMKKRHQITQQDDFGVANLQGQLDVYNKIASGLTIFLGFVAAISLLVGGINIMNILLVSVKERTREIGLRKALGASEEVILVQFVIEALFISVVGGLLGVALGVGLVSLVGILSPLKPEVTPLAILLSVGVSGGIGLFFGVFPARQAADLDPITALRTE